MELLKTRAGLDITHVPYRGAAPMMTDMIAGRVPMSLATVTSALQHIRNGVFIPIAIAGPVRVGQLPDTPTFVEVGVPGVEADAWFAWFAPARTPEPILERLEREIIAIVEQPEVRTRIEGFGMQPATMRRREFAPFVRAEVAKWAEVIRVSGAKLE
jgi:tripartite-type tricarboxylate transporter receptor subunit TctC